MEKLKNELDKLIESGFISVVTWPSEWVSAIVVAPKNNTDDIRLCVVFLTAGLTSSANGSTFSPPR